jgi:hypothetical protein
MSKYLFGLKLLLIPIAMVFLYLAWARSLPLKIDLKTPIQASTSVNQDFPSLIPGKYFQVSISPSKVDAYISAEYRLWIPSQAVKIRGLIVKQHGCGDNAAETGLNYANDIHWQALAAKYQLGLIGTKLPTGNKPCEHWALINYGSGKAFLKALNVLATKSNHPELEAAPWILWGHSGGADWVAQMFQQYPQRTIALVSVRCGGFTFFGRNPELFNTPVLFAVGENEPTVEECVNLPKEVFARYRNAGALWTLAVEVGAGHEVGNSRLLAIPYLDAVIAARLPEQGGQLRPISEEMGWLGNTVTYETEDTSRYRGRSFESVWLPNKEIASKWQEYMKVGKVSPSRKPSTPSNVQAAKTAAKTALVSWEFTPDLENGLPSFRIYRDNVLLTTIQGQKHTFNGAPDPLSIKLEFEDKSARSNSVYTVAATNLLGESISDPARLD